MIDGFMKLWKVDFLKYRDEKSFVWYMVIIIEFLIIFSIILIFFGEGKSIIIIGLV